jgi:hypothetical protein
MVVVVVAAADGEEEEQAVVVVAADGFFFWWILLSSRATVHHPKLSLAVRPLCTVSYRCMACIAYIAPALACFGLFCIDALLTFRPHALSLQIAPHSAVSNDAFL